jgi:hypothetical protein
VACEGRLFQVGGRGDPLGERRPGCGGVLESVGVPSEIVGLGSIGRRGSTAETGAGSTGHRRMDDRVGAIMIDRRASQAAGTLGR